VITIVRATAADWPKLEAIYAADCYFMAAGGMRHRAEAELREFERGKRLLSFAQDGDRVAGTVGLVFEGMDAGFADGKTSANIHRLHVIKMYRREGVATALIRAAMDEALARGLSRVTIEVERDNVPALRLYERLGFRHTGPGHEANEIALAQELR
jgi:ribosomal protein S18 acetylase RimI-like enzyme